MNKQDMLDAALGLLKELRDYLYTRPDNTDELNEILRRVDSLTEDY